MFGLDRVPKFLIGKLKSDTTSTTKHVQQTTTTTTTAFTYMDATVGAGQPAFGTAELKVMAVQGWGFTFVGGGRHSEKNEKNGKERKRTEKNGKERKERKNGKHEKKRRTDVKFSLKIIF